MSPALRRRVKSQKTSAVTEGPGNVVSIRWIWYLVSFFIPFSGMLIALFLYDHDDREARKVGRNCLLIGFILWVVLPFLALAALLLLLLFALIGCAASLMPTD